MTALGRRAIAAAAVGLGVVLLVVERNGPGLSLARAVLLASVGVAMVVAGLVAVTVADRIGVLVVLAGAAWSVAALLQGVSAGVAATTGALLATLWVAVLAHAFVTFPTGRLSSWPDRAVVVSGYVLMIGTNLSYLLALPSLRQLGIDEDNVMAAFGSPSAARRIANLADVLSIGWAVALICLLVAKAIATSPAARTAYGAVWVAAIVVAGHLVGTWWTELDTAFPNRDADDVGLQVLVGLAAIAVPAALVAARVAELRLVALVADLETLGPGVTLRNALRRSLADPGLDIAYLRAGSGGWIDEAGRSMTTPVAPGRRTVTPIERGGKPIAALIHDPVLLRQQDRLQAAIAAASIALDNEQVKAELRAEVHDLRASGTRLIQSADHDRRRAERNLHDGAQQRLVGLALMLRMAGRKAEDDAAVTALLAEAAAELDAALGELRELAAGIHPAIVTATGLAGALEALAERPGLPVDLDVDIPAPLPELVETAAYYVAAEALTNANKHAAAHRVSVQAALAGDTLRLGVSDDGSGGARPAPGSGLEGLADRVGALGGQLVIASTPGKGTTIRADLPLAVQTGPHADPRRLTALRWAGWETFEIPGEAYDQLTDEDNLNWVRGMFACAGGVSTITAAERAWAIGYQASAGTAAWVLEAIRNFDVDERIEDVVALPGMQSTSRGLLYDALRMSCSQGDIAPERLDNVRGAADRLGLSRELVDELHQIVTAQRALRQQRYELITAPALPVM